MVDALKFICLLYISIILNVTEVYLISRNVTARYVPPNYRFVTNSAVSAPMTPSKILGKWQVGRVSRKQYEIINMLHRKTITFLEMESNSAITKNSNNLSKYRGLFNKIKTDVTVPSRNSPSYKAVNPRPNDRALTSSYIEFYYLDESDDRVKRQSSLPKNPRKEHLSDGYKFALLRSPFFLFRVNDATCKPTTLNYMASSFQNNKHFTSHNPQEIEKSKEKHYIQHKFATKRDNKIEMKHKKNITENKKLSFLFKAHRFTPLVPSTPYDRIKFFEIYDSDTRKPRRLTDNQINMINNDNIHSEQKIYLDQVDHDTQNHEGHNMTRYVKKHAKYNFEENKDLNLPVYKIHNNSANTTIKPRKKPSHPAKWSDFPFIAVYVYEPMQVRCTSAAISPHWLVAPATCLYRHYKHRNSNTEGRSAFVAYCGEDWRIPGRIAYVNRIYIHPRFQAKDKSRRRLYNIGLIQVVNSMANTCPGWRPVSLMSHQFVADQDGSFAIALGWDFNRYDTRYSSSRLTSNPLMLYEGLVYSEACPGNTGYRKVQMVNGGSVKNVYCLFLPTHSSDKNDTVHGGLLLIGGKLIALYLQDELPTWDAHLAQYSGIWRLIPWLLDVAREPEDLDSFDTGLGTSVY